MKFNADTLIILSSILVMGFFFNINFFGDNLDTVVSKVDNRKYEVQPKEDSQEAADLIANIRKNLILLVNHLIKITPPDEDKIILLKKNFNPDRLKEGVDNPEYTSYSINKGEQIVLCLRSKDKLMDINTMLFVVLHELAHLATETIGHDETFWDNFRWILEEAINIGIYKKQDFDKNPVEYCGMTITSSPLD